MFVQQHRSPNHHLDNRQTQTLYHLSSNSQAIAFITPFVLIKLFCVALRAISWFLSCIVWKAPFVKQQMSIFIIWLLKLNASCRRTESTVSDVLCLNKWDLYSVPTKLISGNVAVAPVRADALQSIGIANDGKLDWSDPLGFFQLILQEQGVTSFPAPSTNILDKCKAESVLLLWLRKFEHEPQVAPQCRSVIHQCPSEWVSIRAFNSSYHCMTVGCFSCEELEVVDGTV